MVVWACGAQQGKTELVFNILGHRFTDAPTPALYIGPTEKQVSSISRDRIAKMLKSTPILWERLAKGQRDRITEKYIGGVRLGFGWAGSATELASHPAGLVLVDERDRMTGDVGGEGDPVTMAMARTKNYMDAKIGIFSTPTIEGASPIWALFDEGTCEMWAWPCPECKELFIPKLSRLEWPRDLPLGEIRNKAYMVCPHCGSCVYDTHKVDMNAAGRFIPHRKDENGAYQALDALPENSTRSFWVSGLASPWQSFGAIAEVMARAYQSNEPERIQAATNTYCGETYRTAGESVLVEEVAALIQDYAPMTIPHGVQVLSIGADVQKLGIYYVVRGWGFNWESWLIDYGFVAGETELDAVWTLFMDVVIRGYQGGFHVKRGLVDSGYRPGDKLRRPEHMVYRFAGRTAGRMLPAKGKDTLERGAWNHGKTIDGNTLIIVNTDYVKTWLQARIRWPADQPGGWHLHSKVDNEYCRMMVAEEVVVKPSGRRIWVRRPGYENHYLDCEILAQVAAQLMQVEKLQKLPEKTTPIQQKQRENSELKQNKTNRFKRTELF